MVSCLMGDSTALASAIVRCCLIYKQEFGTVESEMLKTASKRMPAGKNSHIHKVFTNFGVDIS